MRKVDIFDWGCAYADGYGSARRLLFNFGETMLNTLSLCVRGGRREEGFVRSADFKSVHVSRPALIFLCGRKCKADYLNF